MGSNWPIWAQEQEGGRGPRGPETHMMGSGEYVDGTLTGKGNNKLSNHLCIFHSSEWRCTVQNGVCVHAHACHKGLERRI